MNILIAENLRKLRQNKNITQDVLAKYLGITPQSVSKWERGEGYPDITMLPIIAGYFGVTIDALIGTDIDEREARICFYCSEYERLNLLGDEVCIEIAHKAYFEYPYEWRIIDIYIRSLTRGYTVPASDKLPELRSLCRFVMDNCNDANIRKTAIYSMLFAENDDKVESWFDEVPTNYDFAHGERREFIKR